MKKIKTLTNKNKPFKEPLNKCMSHLLSQLAMGISDNA